jgi:hypothetical protein
MATDRHLSHLLEGVEQVELVVVMVEVEYVFAVVGEFVFVMLADVTAVSETRLKNNLD